MKKEPNPPRNWTFLTNHAHVLVCLARHGDMPLREVAVAVGITERAVQKIVADFVDCGVLGRVRVGRSNHYTLREEHPLHHPLESHCTVGDLLKMVMRGKRLQK